VAWKRFTSKTGREDTSGEHNGTRVKCMRVDKLPSRPQGRTLFLSISAFPNLVTGGVDLGVEGTKTAGND
jgi:hypothetical protein